MARSGDAARARASASASESGGPSGKGGAGGAGRSATSACARGSRTVVGLSACVAARRKAPAGKRMRRTEPFLRGSGGGSRKVALVSTAVDGPLDAAGPQALSRQRAESQRAELSRRDEAEIVALPCAAGPGEYRHAKLPMGQRLPDLSTRLQGRGAHAARLESVPGRP